MDVVLIYFSQTGNTHKIALAMATTFREQGHSVKTIPLRHAVPEEASKGNLLGVGTPCFSSRAPTPVGRFLRALPQLDGQRAFVFATSSGTPGRVLYDLTSALRSKGADVMGGYLARGQVHHPAPRLTGHFRGRPNAEDLARARRFAAAVADHVSAGRSGPLPESRFDALRRGWGFYDLMGLASSDNLLRLVMPEPKLAQAKCSQCEWCVRECPMENITLRRAPYDCAQANEGSLLRSYPVLGDLCIRCYHCLVGCPKDAFGVDWRLAGRFLLLLYNPTSMRRLGDLEPGQPVH